MTRQEFDKRCRLDRTAPRFAAAARSPDAGARYASTRTSALFYVSNAAQIAASLNKGLLVLKGRRSIVNVVGQSLKSFPIGVSVWITLAASSCTPSPK